MPFFSVSAQSECDPDVFWARWTDLPRSVEWDTDVDWSRLDGPFRPGTRGAFKLKGGPRVPFALDQVEPNRSWSNVIRLPGLRVRFTHEMRRIGAGRIEIVHGAEFSGALGLLLFPIARRALRPALGKGLRNLVALAEQSGLARSLAA